MPELATCPCCPNTAPPAGFDEESFIPGLTAKELEFDESKHLDLGYPEVIKRLDKDMNYDAETVKALPSDYGCCSAFRVMSEEGSRVLNHVLAAIDKYAVSSPRIPKVNRGVTFRHQFLNKLGHSPALLRLVSKLAGCELIYHPMRIQQLHTNLKPQDIVVPGSGDASGKPNVLKRNIDRWHCDTTGFVVVLFCTDPDAYEGGELQYFNGTRDEGTRLLSASKTATALDPSTAAAGAGAGVERSSGGLPADRVLNVGRQQLGFGVFMQGCRVFHQVTPVLRGEQRTTVVFSFQPVDALALEATTHLSQTYNQVDPFHLFLPDWVRYRAWKVLVRFDTWWERQRQLREMAKGGGEEEEKVEDFDMLDGDAKAVAAVVQACSTQLRTVVETLPYTADRQTLTQTVAAVALELRRALANQRDPPGALLKLLPAGTAQGPRVLGVQGIAGSLSEGECDGVGAAVASLSSDTDSAGPCKKQRVEQGLAGITEQGRLALREDPRGWGNLLGAVQDLEGCVEDVLTIKENVSTMEYF